MRALSIRQPFAELILRGIKTVEYRSRPTRIIGERFHIYAGKKKLAVASDPLPGKTWSRDLRMARAGELPEWMVELAAQIKLLPQDLELPRGVIVGSAVVERCEEVEATERQSDEATEGKAKLLHPSSLRRSVASSLIYAWHLAGVQRAKKLRKPTGHPQPVWFEPF
jgi:hypothetical protein